MKIHSASLERLRQSELRGEGLGTIFEHLAHLASSSGAGAQTLHLNWVQPDDFVEEGDLLPTITLSVSPMVKPPA